MPSMNWRLAPKPCSTITTSLGSGGNLFVDLDLVELGEARLEVAERLPDDCWDRSAGSGR